MSDLTPHSELSGRIWLIGGTQESALLATAIAEAQLPCIITVTTESARGLYAQVTDSHHHSLIQVWVGRLIPETIGPFLQAHQIAVVLDASHPFAVEISQLAIAKASQWQLPYLRYERPNWQDQSQDSSNITLFASFEALLASQILLGQRALLIVGYRPLALFLPWQSQATLFARILPSVTALEAAIAAGFTPDRLFAMRPPINANLEKALWQQWQTSLVVTKASGVAGGEDVKRQVAQELGVQLVAIARPDMAYPQQTSDLKTAIKFCSLYV